MATVKVENGRSVAMSELQTGDKVKTGFSIKLVLSIQTRNSKTNIMKPFWIATWINQVTMEMFSNLSIDSLIVDYNNICS